MARCVSCKSMDELFFCLSKIDKTKERLGISNVKMFQYLDYEKKEQWAISFDTKTMVTDVEKEFTGLMVGPAPTPLFLMSTKIF